MTEHDAMTKRTNKATANEQTEALKRLTQGAAAWLLGIGPRTLRDAADCPRNPDRTYNGQAVVRWHAARSAGGSDGDPLLTGGASPALEEYRRHRAGLAELELNERRGRLVDVDAFGEWWETEVATPIRRGIEALQRQHGPAAAEIIVKALAKAETAVGKRIDHETPSNR